MKHGTDERKDGKPLDPALRGKLIAEARRLGAGPNWTPEMIALTKPSLDRGNLPQS